VQKVGKSNVIFKAGDSCLKIALIAGGNVCATIGDYSFTLNPGEIVGLFDMSNPEYICEYKALTDVSLTMYEIHNYSDFEELLKTSPGLLSFMFNTIRNHLDGILSHYYEAYSTVSDLLQFVTQTKNRYQTICKVIHTQAKSLPVEQDILDINYGDSMPLWLKEYHQALTGMAQKAEGLLTPVIIYGFIFNFSKDLKKISGQLLKLSEGGMLLSNALINEDYLDYFELYSSLYHYAQGVGTDSSAISNVLNSISETAKKYCPDKTELIVKREIEFKSRNVVSVSASQTNVNDAIMLAKLSCALDDILQFSGLDAVKSSNFKKLIESFKKVTDKDSSNEQVSDLRKELSLSFNKLYAAVMKNALKSDGIPNIIKMFLNFGFVDTELVGSDNAIELYKISESFDGDSTHHIYTIYEWFKAIYSKKKIPSKNEFEQDYLTYLNNQVKEGSMSKEKMFMIKDSLDDMIDYELNNLFPSVNRITFGRVLTYCPVLTKENLIKLPTDMLLTPMKYMDSMEKWNDIDYSVFYHEYSFEDYGFGVKDIVRINITPDVILMPNSGMRGTLWQEIEGNDRRSPGRIFFPIFFTGDLDKAMLRVMAEFRWEMCKREAGIRWNDFTSHCLTSDYCDYAQFFSKNHDLSSEAREKIRELLKRSKNSFKEMFINDYIIYMLYEVNGSCRLNKIARQILFKYCPPCKESRLRLSGNALFEELLRRHEIASGQILHRLELINNKYTQAGKEIPNEFKIQAELINK